MKMKPKAKPVTHPCPLCGQELGAELTVCAHVSEGTRYANVVVKFTCWNQKCRYEERTKGECRDEETIQKMRDLSARFRGAAMFSEGKFNDGSVGINRRRHVGIGRFEPVTKPAEKGGKQC